jgi:hypothetical protein
VLSAIALTELANVVTKSVMAELALAVCVEEVSKAAVETNSWTDCPPLMPPILRPLLTDIDAVAR